MQHVPSLPDVTPDLPPGPPPDGVVRLTAWVRGRVQGVGFRWWTRCRALELGLRGTASNLSDGRVEVVAEGDRAACTTLLTMLSEQPPRDPPSGASRSWYRRPGRVSGVVYRWAEPHGLTGFHER
ncbi:MAG: acylphosphatase [Actinomycetota bacterium]|nr:acylphosphatase [Actinomycetota bacterium]